MPSARVSHLNFEIKQDNNRTRAISKVLQSMIICIFHKLPQNNNRIMIRTAQVVILRGSNLFSKRQGCVWFLHPYLGGIPAREPSSMLLSSGKRNLPRSRVCDGFMSLGQAGTLALHMWRQLCKQWHETNRVLTIFECQSEASFVWTGKENKSYSWISWFLWITASFGIMPINTLVIPIYRLKCRTKVQLSHLITLWNVIKVKLHVEGEQK